MNNTLNYYDVGTVDAPVVSSSSLADLNPAEGGSPKAFLNFFKTRAEREELQSLTRGKLIHRFIENPSLFIVSDVEEPTPMMAKLLKTFVTSVNDFKNGIVPELFKDIDVAITSKLATENGRVAQILETQTHFENLAGIVKLDSDTCIKLFRYSRTITDSYTSRTEVVVLTDILKNYISYINYLFESREKICLTRKEKDKIDGATTSLYTTPKVATLLSLGSHSDLDSFDELVYKEIAIYWQERVFVMGDDSLSMKINCKALLDCLKVNHKQKYIKYTDLKSTSYSIYTYQRAFEEYRTYRQLAFYKRAITTWFKNTFPDISIEGYKFLPAIVPVETSGLYLCGIYPVQDTWFFKGRDEIYQLLKRFAWHKYKDIWDMSYEEYHNDGMLQLTDPV